MALIDDLNSYAGTTFRSVWAERAGQVVPDPTSLTASNDAISFDRATVLYADLSGSTSMVQEMFWQASAEIYKTFLYCAARLINQENGTITAYDGDRVMGVFVGNSQSTSATRCALKINHAVKNVVMPAFKATYPLATYQLRHVVGIDTSPIRVTKTGVRGENDLVWVGRAANYAAKLSDMSEGYTSYITGDVFDQIAAEAKFTNNVLMWEKRNWPSMNHMVVYRSNWWWPF